MQHILHAISFDQLVYIVGRISDQLCSLSKKTKIEFILKIIQNNDV